MQCQFTDTPCTYISCGLWSELRQACRFVLAIDKILGADDGLRPLHLTSREQGVLNLIVQGYSNKQIGLALCISYQTAKNHVAHVLQKLGATSRTEAVVNYYKHKEQGYINGA